MSLPQTILVTSLTSRFPIQETSQDLVGTTLNPDKTQKTIISLISDYLYYQSRLHRSCLFHIPLNFIRSLKFLFSYNPLAL